MSDTGELYLGAIAFAVLLMAAIQVTAIVAAIVAGIRLTRRVDQIATQLEQEVKPLLTNLTAVTTEAARTAALAAKQVERFDKVFAELTERVDQTLAAAQSFVVGPARQGMAIFAGFSALIDSLRGLREQSRRRQASRPVVDEEESLFIG